MNDRNQMPSKLLNFKLPFERYNRFRGSRAKLKGKKKELCKQIEKLFLLAFLTYWPDQHIHSNTIKNSIKLIRKTIKIYIVQHKCGHITSRLPNYERGNQWKKITNYGNIPIVFNQYFPNYTMIYSSIVTNIFSNISLL